MSKKHKIISHILKQAKLGAGDPAIDENRILYGLDMPGIMMQWMIGLPGWPLGKIVHLAGPEKSYKTSLGYEVARWFLENDGLFFYIHTEGRDNPGQRKAFLPGDYADRVQVKVCSTLEEWCRFLVYVVKGLYDLHKEGEKLPPTCIVVDSLVGAASEKHFDEIDKDGLPKAAYPHEAKQLSHVLKFVSNRIIDLPVSVIVINHLRQDLSSLQPGAKRTPGGTAIKYFESLEIWSNATKPGPSGKVEVSLIVKNSSLGPPYRGFKVTVSWHGPDLAVWEWEYDSVLWLREPSSKRIPGVAVDYGKLSKSVRDALGDLTFSPAHRKVTCPALGLNKADVEQFWDTLKGNPELWSGLLRATGVRLDNFEFYRYEEE